MSVTKQIKGFWPPIYNFDNLIIYNCHIQLLNLCGVRQWFTGGSIQLLQATTRIGTHSLAHVSPASYPVSHDKSVKLTMEGHLVVKIPLSRQCTGNRRSSGVKIPLSRQSTENLGVTWISKIYFPDQFTFTGKLKVTWWLKFQFHDNPQGTVDDLAVKISLSYQSTSDWE